MVKTDIRVIYGDTDQMGFVYYANYLRFFESGRNEYLRARGAPYREVEAELGIRLPVVEASVHYKAPARYDDLISIETFVTRVQGVRLTFGYRLVDSEKRLLAEASTAHVCASLEDKPRRIPPELHALLLPYLRPTEAAAVEAFDLS